MSDRVPINVILDELRLRPGITLLIFLHSTTPGPAILKITLQQAAGNALAVAVQRLIPGQLTIGSDERTTCIPASENF
jgi:hypothetical protein